MANVEAVETGRTLLRKEGAITAKDYLFNPLLFAAIERVKLNKPRYSDLKHPTTEIKNKENGSIVGVVVELSWKNVGEKKRRGSKIMVYPDGLLEFGYDTVTFLGRSSLSKKTCEEIPGKVDDNLSKLMRHSPKVRKSK